MRATLTIGLCVVGAACIRHAPPVPAAAPGPAPAPRTAPAAAHDADQGKQWRFAGFFNRVRQQVGAHWHPEEAYRRRDPTGTTFGLRERRYTELGIELTPEGDLRNVRLVQPSGLEFLDDLAIEAIRASAPFSHPPRGMVERDGVVRFKFGFLFDPKQPPGQRWFQYLGDDGASADGGAGDQRGEERDGG